MRLWSCNHIHMFSAMNKTHLTSWQYVSSPANVAVSGPGISSRGKKSGRDPAMTLMATYKHQSSLNNLDKKEERGKRDRLFAPAHLERRHPAIVPRQPPREHFPQNDSKAAGERGPTFVSGPEEEMQTQTGNMHCPLCRLTPT